MERVDIEVIWFNCRSTLSIIHGQIVLIDNANSKYDEVCELKSENQCTWYTLPDVGFLGTGA